MCRRYADVTLNVCQFVRPSRSDVVLKLSYKLVTKLFHHLLGPSFSRNVVFWAKSVLQNSDSSTLTRALYTGLVGLRKIRCSRQMFQPTYPNVSTVNWRKLKDIWIAAYVLHEGGFAWKRRRIWHILAWIRMFWAIKHRNPSRGLPCMRVQSDFRLNFDGFRRHGVCSYFYRASTLTRNIGMGFLSVWPTVIVKLWLVLCLWIHISASNLFITYLKTITLVFFSPKA